MGVSEDYAKVISDSGLVQIYVTVMNDLTEEFRKAADLNITYQGPMLKTTLTTMEDATDFRKRDANGDPDNGLYAAREAYKKHGGPPWRTAAVSYQLPEVGASRLASLLAKDYELGASFNMPGVANGVDMAEIPDQANMDGIMADSVCDDPWLEGVDTMSCPEATEQLFEAPADIESQAKNAEAVIDGALRRSAGL